MRNEIKKALIGSSDDDSIENIELLIEAKVDEARATWIKATIIVAVMAIIVFVGFSMRN